MSSFMPDLHFPLSSDQGEDFVDEKKPMNFICKLTKCYFLDKFLSEILIYKSTNPKE